MGIFVFGLVFSFIRLVVVVVFVLCLIRWVVFVSVVNGFLLL